MDKEEIIKELKKLISRDIEDNHWNADSLLLKFINDKEIQEAYTDIDKWYA